MKILILGDLHADPSSIVVVGDALTQHNPDLVFQCGDLGYWPRQPGGPLWLDRLSTMIGEGGTRLYFADGNHEDHAMLDHTALSPYPVAPNIYHVPRGVVMRVGRRRVMFMGGARSVDRTYRRRDVTWFADELPSEEQMRRATESGKVDVVIAHDSPSWVDYGYPPHHLSGWPMIDLEVSHNFRLWITETLVPAVKPTLWFNGHHHRRVTQEFDGLTVHTLAESMQPATAWQVLWDTETMEVT